MIHYKQEKWDLAEFHLRKALDINRTSTILHCYVGMVPTLGWRPVLIP